MNEIPTTAPGRIYFGVISFWVEIVGATAQDPRPFRPLSDGTSPEVAVLVCVQVQRKLTRGDIGLKPVRGERGHPSNDSATNVVWQPEGRVAPPPMVPGRIEWIASDEEQPAEEINEPVRTAADWLSETCCRLWLPLGGAHAG